MCPSISVKEKVKEKLEKLKEEKGCTSLSDAINLLIENHIMLKKLKNALDLTNYVNPT